jgi:heat shock protein HslJ
MRRRAWAPVALSLPFLLIACAGIVDAGGQDGGGDLTGVTWVLDRASIMTLVDEVPKDARVDIAFTPTEVSGLAACNQYGGGYQVDTAEGSLRFGQLASTEMACVDDGLMALESVYLTVLGDVTGYQVTGDQVGLQLIGGAAALTFQPEQATAALPLEGTAWTLTTVAQPDTQAVSSTIAGSKVTLMLDAGNAAGSGGCNTYHASYETTGDSGLVFGPIASTKMLCEQGISDQERAYFAALGRAVSSAVAGHQLTLSDADGQILLAFSGRPVHT